MEQLKSYGDTRALAFCAFCGGVPSTRDHCPSRVFLDEPFPENLPVVPACAACNGKFSESEEYLACLLSCVIAGSTELDMQSREKTKRILSSKPALRARIEASRIASDQGVVFEPEHDRVSLVVTKLAQGHALYELNETCAGGPAELAYAPFSLMTDVQREAFENPKQAGIWPEVGSRAMQRLFTSCDLSPEGWLVVQPNRYRFNVSPINGVEVRIVMDEYLACQVRWEY